MRFLSWIFVFYCFALTMLKGGECSTTRPPLWATWSSRQPSSSGHQQTRNRAETCNTTNCVWSWGPCSKLCGGGTRNATLIEPEGNCGSCDMPWEAGSCNTSPCPPPPFHPIASASSTNCSCGEWQAWSHCIASSCSSKTGVQIRNHANFLTCFKPECRTASTQNCTNPCTWNPWGEFTPCSQACGNVSTRLRVRTVTPSFCTLLRCNGSIEEENCTVPACTCDPEPWGPWGWCTTPCGPGTRTRRRIHSPCSAEPTVMSVDCGNVPCYNSSTIISVTPTENISIPLNTTGTPLAVTGPNSSSRIYSTFVPLILAFATLFGTSSIAE